MAIENKFLDSISRSFNLDLPMMDTMDEYLDLIIPLIRPWSEDLYEEEFFLETRWLEIRDDDNFHESVLHIFREENEYLNSIDGNIHKGKWRILEKSNTLIIEQMAGSTLVRSELYDLAFLNGNFFILQKHGDQQRKGFKKYFVLGRERYVGGLEWKEVMELMFNQYRNNRRWIFFVVAFIILVAIFIFFSVF